MQKTFSNIKFYAADNFHSWGAPPPTQKNVLCIGQSACAVIKVLSWNPYNYDSIRVLYDFQTKKKHKIWPWLWNLEILSGLAYYEVGAGDLDQPSGHGIVSDQAAKLDILFVIPLDLSSTVQSR